MLHSSTFAVLPTASTKFR